uniref:Uncharacterized protein n=1 Tax=Hucho hucho TaxID=62062 RepID=A0A4W5MC80_9TELE
VKRVNVLCLLLAGVLGKGKVINSTINLCIVMYLFNFSEHHNKHEDRLWDFGCKSTLDSATKCFTSSYVNDIDKPFNYQRPYHQVITGMNSYHETKHEDRRWKFTCCAASNFGTDICQWTNYINCFDEAFTVNVPPNSYLIEYDEDRCWKYQYWTERSC